MIHAASVYSDKYAAKRLGADEAAALVQDGWVVCVNGAGSFPCDFVDALTQRAESLSGVTLSHPMRRSGRALKFEPVSEQVAQHITHVSDFTFDPHIRDAINAGIATYRPNIPTETVRFFPHQVDLFVSAASPMDHGGYFSLGPFGGWGTDFIRVARRVVLEVNPAVPRIHGECIVHIDDIDAVIEADYPLVDLHHSSSGEEVVATAEQEAVAQNVASLIDDGCSIQFGGGKLPDIVARTLIAAGRRHLTVHTEAVGDWLVDCVEAGVVDNHGQRNAGRRKTLFALALGTRRLYDYLDDNLGVEQRSMSYVNDPTVIARNERQVSVNSTLAVDLWGQCASETLGGRHYSGTGGQWEFNRGAYLSPGGRGIVALLATARGGEVSRITASLSPMSAVSISRNDVDYVVTEYGVAHLKGHDVRSRAHQLIAIAHPDFRPGLTDEARRMYLI